MVRIIASLIFLTLFSQTVVARDYKTVFHARITTEGAVADSDCNNKDSEVIPISNDLNVKGWVCVLMPRKLVNGRYGQAIVCQNKNGAMVNTLIHCNANESSSDKGDFTLDDVDEKVKGTNFILTCSTVSGERI